MEIGGSGLQAYASYRSQFANPSTGAVQPAGSQEDQREQEQKGLTAAAQAVAASNTSGYTTSERGSRVNLVV
jgi:hypothetical protein